MGLSLNNRLLIENGDIQQGRILGDGEVGGSEDERKRESEIIRKMKVVWSFVA